MQHGLDEPEGGLSWTWLITGRISLKYAPARRQRQPGAAVGNLPTCSYLAQRKANRQTRAAPPRGVRQLARANLSGDPAPGVRGDRLDQLRQDVRRDHCIPAERV